jgi:hypothetical protein
MSLLPGAHPLARLHRLRGRRPPLPSSGRFLARC